MNAANTRSLVDLTERVAALGSFVLRGDVERYVQSVERVTSGERRELAARLNEPLASLVGIVDEYGAALTLQAIEQVRSRVRAEHYGLGRGGQA